MRNFESKKERKIWRHKRIRAKIFGTEKRPRLCVFRSHKHIYAQLVDDKKNKVILEVNDFDLSKNKTEKEKEIGDKKLGKLELKKFDKVLLAYRVGRLLAQEALKHKITEAVFDRGGNTYHGRVEALAQGARDNGLKF